MSKGENIFKRRDGRWEARYIKGRDLSGKIKYGFCYGKTYKEAKEKVNKCKAMLLNGTPLPLKKGVGKLNYYCDEWLKNNKNHLKESTFVKYAVILERHIKPKLGNYSPLVISTELINLFSNELLHEKKLAAKTVKDILVVLRSVLKYTARLVPGMSGSIEIIYPKEKKKKMRVLSTEEHRILMQYLIQDMDNCKFGILLALFTGIRIGELCALKWDAISLKDKTIHIESTMQRLKSLDQDCLKKTRIVMDTPKSDTSMRSIPMTDSMAELCSRMKPEDINTYILTGTTHYMEPRTLQYRFNKYIHECGLTDVHFHTLRHTFATRCVEVGFEIKSLSEILGHANTTITLERYVHSSMELKRNNMNKLTAIDFQTAQSKVGVAEEKNTCQSAYL